MQRGTQQRGAAIPIQLVEPSTTTNALAGPVDLAPRLVKPLPSASMVRAPPPPCRVKVLQASDPRVSYGSAFPRTRLSVSSEGAVPQASDIVAESLQGPWMVAATTSVLGTAYPP